MWQKGSVDHSLDVTRLYHTLFCSHQLHRVLREPELAPGERAREPGLLFSGQILS